MEETMLPKSTTAWALATLVVASAFPARAERVPLSRSFAHAGYEQIAQRRGVTVYKHRDSDIIKLGADGRIDAPPDEVLQTLLDYERQVGVIDRLTESKVVARRDGRLRVYQRLNLPVIDDRDFTLDVRWGRSGDLRWITYRAVRSGSPERDGVVRVTHHQGSWQLEPLDGGRATSVRFMVAIDLGGWLPKWMARAGSGKELPELFASVRQLVRSSSEHGRRLSWSSK
jgi:hypothetical protein